MKNIFAKKILSFFAALSMAATLCSCDSGNNVETDTSAQTESSANVSAESKITSASETQTETSVELPPMDTSPITLSLFIFGSYEDIPFAAAIAASPIPVLPLVSSIIVSSFVSFPDFSPSSIIARAILSLTL